MSVFSKWFKNQNHRRKLSEQKGRRNARARRAILEQLESRKLLAVVSWAAPVDGNWHDAANWDTGNVPGPGDDVVIDASGSPYTVTLQNLNVTGANAINSLTIDSGDATFFQNIRTLEATSNIDVNSGEAILRGADWTGTASLTNDATLTILGSSDIDTPLTQNGTVIIAADSNLTGTLNVGASGTNNGTILLQDNSPNGNLTARLSVDNGFTLTNAAGGTITTVADGSAAGFRQLAGDFVNDGTINVNENSQFTSGVGVTNNGQITVASGKTFDSFQGGNQVFNLNAGNVDVDGVFIVSQDTVNFNGGTITGNGLSLNSQSDLTIAAAATGEASFNIRGNVDMTGDLAADQTVRIQGVNTTSATLTTLADFTNDGLILLEDASTNGTFTANATLLVNAGTTLTNSGTGEVRTVADATNQLGDRSIRGNINNAGQLNFQEDTLYTSNGVLTNTGIIDIAAGKLLDAVNGVQTFNQNAGSFNIDGEFRTSSDDFNFHSGSFTGNAPLLQFTDLVIGPGSTGSAEFLIRGGQNTVTGDVAAAQTIRVQAFGTSSATLNATGSFTNHGLIVLEDASTSGSEAGNATLTINNNGTLTNAAGATLQINPDGNDQLGDRSLNGNITNDGTINFDEGTAFLTGNRTITNNGIINIAAGKVLEMDSGVQTINQNAGSFNVDGSLELSSDTVNFNGGVFTGNAPRMFSSSLNVASTGAGEFHFRGSTNNISGTIAADQVVRVQADGTSSVILRATTDVTNNGLLVLEDISTSGSFAANVALQLNNDSVLTNSASGTFDILADTNGQVGDRSVAGSVVNFGVFNVNENTLHSSGSITNEGAMTIAAGKLLDQSNGTEGFFQDAGTLVVAGTLGLATPGFNNPSGMEFNGGVISGGGSIDGFQANITGSGDAAVDWELARADVNIGTASDPTGILNVNVDGSGTGGTWTHDANSDLTLDIAGAVAGTGFDQLNIAGEADLSGDLTIAFDPSFAPHSCQTFNVINFDSRVGTDPNITVTGLPANFDSRVDFTPTGVSVIAFDTSQPINIHPVSLQMTEGGATMTYATCLATTTAPGDDVTVTATSTGGDVTITPGNISFSPTG